MHRPNLISKVKTVVSPISKCLRLPSFTYMRQWTLQNTNSDKNNRRRWWRRRQWRRQQQTIRFNNELQQTSTSNWEKNPSFQRHNTNKNRTNTHRYEKGYCLSYRSSRMHTNLTPSRTLALDKHFSEKSVGKISCSFWTGCIRFWTGKKSSRLSSITTYSQSIASTLAWRQTLR